MKEKTQNIIFALKDNPVEKFDESIQCFFDKKLSKKELNEIATNAFLDFLTTADNPSETLNSFFVNIGFKNTNRRFNDEESLEYRVRQGIWMTLDLVKVTENDHFINGFKGISLSQFEYEFLKKCQNDFPSYTVIARNIDGKLNLYKESPIPILKTKNGWTGYINAIPIVFDDMFTFINYNDDKPYVIEEIFNHCEIKK